MGPDQIRNELWFVTLDERAMPALGNRSTYMQSELCASELVAAADKTATATSATRMALNAGCFV